MALFIASETDCVLAPACWLKLDFNFSASEASQNSKSIDSKGIVEASICEWHAKNELKKNKNEVLMWVWADIVKHVTLC